MIGEAEYGGICYSDVNGFHLHQIIDHITWTMYGASAKLDRNLDKN